MVCQVKENLQAGSDHEGWATKRGRGLERFGFEEGSQCLRWTLNNSK